MKLNRDLVTKRARFVVRLVVATGWRLLHELGCCLFQAWTQVVRLFALCSAYLRRWLAQLVLNRAMLRLGEDAFVAGEGSSEIHEQLTALESPPTPGSQTRLQTFLNYGRRRSLLVRLGASIALSGSRMIQNAKFQDVQRLQAQLDLRVENSARSLSSLLPADGQQWTRALLGLFVLGVGTVALSNVPARTSKAEPLHITTVDAPQIVLPEPKVFLSSTEWQELKRACDAGLPQDEAVARLIAALGDPVRCVDAMRTLSRYGAGAKSAVPKLRDILLAAQEPMERWSAAQTLRSIGPAAIDSRDALLQSLRDEEWTVRVEAAESLYRINPSDLPKAEATLLDVIKTDDLACFAMCSAASTLIKISPSHRTQAIDLLTKKLTTATTLAEKLATLGAFQDAGTLAAPAAPFIASVIINEDAHLRGRALASLNAVLQEPENTAPSTSFDVIGTKALIDRLSSDLKQERVEASCKLIRCVQLPPQQRLALKAALFDREMLVRTNAALALSQQGESGIADLIMELHGAEYGQVQPDKELACIIGLTFAGEAAVAPLIDTLEARQNHTVALAMSALASIGKPAVPKLVSALSGGDDRVRYWAVTALGLIGPDAIASEKELEALTHDLSPRVRENAAKSLKAVRSPPEYKDEE